MSSSVGRTADGGRPAAMASTTDLKSQGTIMVRLVAPIRHAMPATSRRR